MTKDDVTFESFGMSVQAIAIAKALKRMMVPAEKQDEFVKQYKSCLREVLKDMQSRHSELSPIIQRLLSDEHQDKSDGQ